VIVPEFNYKLNGRKIDASRIVQHSKLRQSAIDLARPLVETLAVSAYDIRRRIVSTATDEHGRSFGGYKGKRGKKNFYRTGTMWRSLRVKLTSPVHAAAGLSGKAAHGVVKSRKTKKDKARKASTRRLTNIALGRMLVRKEGRMIMDFSPRDIRQAQSMMRNALSDEVARKLAFEIVRFDAEKIGRAGAAKIRKAMRELRKR